MSDPPVDTARLHGWLDGMRGGDRAAREELLRSFSGRLEQLASKMLRRFPTVRRWADTGDVLQNSLLRLLRALEEVRPPSIRAFYGLAAEQMRRELLDLSRHFSGPHGLDANHASHFGRTDQQEPEAEPVDARNELDDLGWWCRFHEAVAQLPTGEREVVGLAFYHGWTQIQIAELFGVSERTVRRRWEAACVRLHVALNDDD